MSKRHSIIALITDLGQRDPAIAQFKASVLEVNPLVHFVDVTHEIKPRDLLEAELAESSKVEPGLLVLVEQDPSGSPSAIAYAATPGFEGAVPAETLQRILDDSIHPVLDAGDLNAATIVAVARPLMELSGELPGGPASDPGAPADAPPPGPPFPEPEIDRAVYDFAGVFQPETIAACG